jgi:hypothetical protein
LADAEFISSSVIDEQTGRTASVRWRTGLSLVPEVAQLASRMGFTPSEIGTIGELLGGLRDGEVTFLRGAVVLPDEFGIPAGLFGWDTPGAIDCLTVRSS